MAADGWLPPDRAQTMRHTCAHREAFGLMRPNTHSHKSACTGWGPHGSPKQKHPAFGASSSCAGPGPAAAPPGGPEGGAAAGWRLDIGAAAGVKGFTQIYNTDLPLGFPKSSGTIPSKFAKSSLLAYLGGDRTLSVGNSRYTSKITAQRSCSY